MIDRRTFLALTGAAGAGALITGCANRSGSGPNEVRLWGMGGVEAEAQQQIVDAFTAENPSVTVSQSLVPSTGTGDATAAITAVRGGTAPDLWLMDRFAVAQYASLGLLEPLDPLIAQHENDDFLDQWMPFALNELRYDGQIYGLPFDTDSRGVFYNRTTLADSGLDPDELDPSNGPVTLDRVLEMNGQIAQEDDRGNYTRLGLIPWDAEGWALTWMFGKGAVFFDDATCAVDVSSDEVVGVLDSFYTWAREMDYPRVDAFKATYQPPNAPPAQTSFFGGQQGMQISGPFTINSIATYVPDLDYGFTYLPLWNEGDDPYTWSGGFSLVAPRGSSLSPAVWEFIKFYCGAPGQRIAMTPLKKIPTHLDVLADPEGFDQNLSFFADQLEFSTSRPPLPIGSLFWDSLVQAQQSVLIGSADAQTAAERAQARVTPQMDLYCPFELPPGFGTTGA
ncbi:extracellular solute-binding protein family 1 [Beutenbergia cavernae DSM 12333]|uniref:Extracellular solute-binding protein family 1 n=1 Tax=Beutenbergia cavernae (strain ATCC BAA-8 / DSM 12333 / CCUG 43141 / JCM 11478 / NBRC 16432 / NCIMB 13614 / HKI 0122) TaxID=471853 RepID=C5BZR5_BEUC1|nr:ABC transporter substrate-binding protein [Beutenbergia cavernae]ACQ81245.1 extracellular solute-binding protein family 1 [Beutenbergia cavernae DSM 12333]